MVIEARLTVTLTIEKHQSHDLMTIFRRYIIFINRRYQGITFACIFTSFDARTAYVYSKEKKKQTRLQNPLYLIDVLEKESTEKAIVYISI